MSNTMTSLAAILQAEKLRHPDATFTAILGDLDARIVPVFRGTIESLPTANQRLVLNGLCTRIGQIDDYLATVGHPEFKEHPRLQGALGFFAKPEVTVEIITAPNESLGGKSPLDTFEEIRRSLWKSIHT